MRAMTIGELRATLMLIGNAHDHKPVAVLRLASNKNDAVVYLSACAAVQSDRILFEAGETP